MDYYTAHSDIEYSKEKPTTTIEMFNNQKALWRRQRDEMREEGQKLLFDALQDLFNNNENLKEISWTQYTPWFNYGDTCEFITHATSPNVNGWEENSWWYGLEGESDEEDPDETNKQVKVSDEVYKEILNILNILDEDDYKEIFGDHVKVIITKEGYEVEGYSHD